MTSIDPGGEDMRCWRKESAGICSTKALYKELAPKAMGPHYLWNKLWKLEIPSKLKMFA